MTGATSPSSVFRRPDHVAWRAIAGETVLVDLRTNTMIGLNAGGGLLWQALDRPAWAARLAGAFGFEPDVVATFLADLNRRGLLEAVEEEQPADDLPDLAPPPSATPAPAIAWTEELRSVANECLYLPGQGSVCTPSPGS